jgi:hypothetical protein
MANSKTYLNVPYAQKDEAKALGAKWDASNKKWYVPDSLDITLFEKWNTEALPSVTNKAKSPSSGNKSPLDAITRAKDKNFVAYNGNQPPWE